MPFPSPKVNVIVQLDFEFAYDDVAVQYVNHYATENPPPPLLLSSFLFFQISKFLFI